MIISRTQISNNNHSGKIPTQKRVKKVQVNNILSAIGSNIDPSLDWNEKCLAIQPSKASVTPANTNSHIVKRYCPFNNAITMGTVKIMRIIESALGSIEKLMIMLTSNR